MSTVNNSKSAIFGALFVSIFPAFLGCEGGGTQITGSGTQTTNGGLREGEVSGVLVDLNGNPVKDVKVRAWAADAPGISAGGSDDSVYAVTDSTGRYQIFDLAAGNYNVIGMLGAGVATVFIPDVKLGDSGVFVGVDTLKPPGKIVGKAVTSEGPLEGVFCYIPGSSYIYITDEDGSFALDRIPEGTYRLKYAAAGYITVTDTVAVVSGEVLVLPPQRIGPDLTAPPPTPQGLRAEYDTVYGEITFRWDPISLADLDGYIFFLEEEGKEPRQLQFIGRDSMIAISNLSDIFLPGRDWEGRDTGTMVFMMKARDVEGNISRLYSEPFALRMTRPQFYQGGFAVLPVGIGDTASCRDTLDIRLTYDNPLPTTIAGVIRATHYTEPGPGESSQEELYQERIWTTSPGDTATFTWYYGKTEDVGKRVSPVAQYPDREIFDNTTFIFEVSLSAHEGKLGQDFYVDAETVGGCFRPKPARGQLPGPPY